MLQFRKLRLNGFKSFVDKTELEINTGLTGIVGPNGCGKSNLVEALRWVMGETSARRMRGKGGMEDVIFNGTADRPSRNHAEVSLLLGNPEKTAPAAFNNEEEIEVIRRIEKDKGSLYKLNGKTMRARDVQMMFADTVTGANSPAMVSQGRVTEMINAKPQERRLVLEESAGVSGLYVRRHEAELRLRAADNNLQRLEDLVGSMEGRLNSLKKQARQAARYKNLSSEIRTLEFGIAYLEWRTVVNKISAAKKTFGEAESLVAEHMTTVTQLTKTQNSQAEELPALRKKEAESSAALQAQKLTLQRIEDQEQALENQITETKEQLAQAEQDKRHEQHSFEENTETLNRLKQEEVSLQANEGNEEQSIAEKQAEQEKLESIVSDLEEKLEGMMASIAENRASMQSAQRQVTADQSRLSVAQERKESLAQRLTQTQERFNEDNQHGELKTDIVELEDSISSGQSAIDTLQNELQNLDQTVSLTRDEQQKSAKEKSEISTEIKTLETVLQSEGEEEFRPVLSDIEPDQGFETALSRALGDTLMASTDDGAPVVWQTQSFDEGQFPEFPTGIKPLQPHVKAPNHLKAALSLIGVAENMNDASDIAKQLKPGQ